MVFSVRNLQKVFLRETHFRKVFFCTFNCNHGAVTLRLQVLVLSGSVTKARPAKTSQKLNINRLDLRVRIFR